MRIAPKKASARKENAGAMTQLGLNANMDTGSHCLAYFYWQ